MKEPPTLSQLSTRPSTSQRRLCSNQSHPDDIEFYYDIKDPVCDVVMDAAEEWAHLTGWQMGPADV